MVVVRTIIGIVLYFLFAGIIIYFVHTAVQEVKAKRYRPKVKSRARKRREIKIDPEEEKRFWAEQERLNLEEEKKFQEELKRDSKNQLKIQKNFLEKCKLNYKLNIYFRTDESIKVHFERLKKFKASMFLSEMYYMGERGGIYTLTTNGTRNYKY